MNEPITLTGIVESLRRRGFTASFEAAPPELRVTGRDTRYRPDQLQIVEHHRLEGVSDPAEMAVVYALEADDGTRGTLVDAFGTYADPEVGSVLRGIADRAEHRRAS
jgi:hypothetical protein